MIVEDCIARDKSNPVTDPRQTSRSVTEMKEWVCSKITKPDGNVRRDCTRLYTGGEAFTVCYTNTAEGSTCLCSAELCNGAVSRINRFSFIAAAAASVLSSILMYFPHPHLHRYYSPLSS